MTSYLGVRHIANVDRNVAVTRQEGVEIPVQHVGTLVGAQQATNRDGLAFVRQPPYLGPGSIEIGTSEPSKVHLG